jgi:predicted transport protein
MDKALQSMIDHMPEKTGKSLIEWKALLQAKKFDKHSEAVKFLKNEHGVTHGFANMIVHSTKDVATKPVDLISEQYAGKEALLDIYNKLISEIKKLGNDIAITPKKSSVSIIRNRQFALIKPATKTRIDLGLKIDDMPFKGRLQNSGPFGALCSHRVQLTAVEEVDGEVMGWIREAYRNASK